MNAPLSVAICGTTERTVQCAESLRTDPRFTISWVVTPPPKPIGRQQHITPTPVDEWAKKNHFPVTHVEKSLKPLEPVLTSLPPVDFLLVVDFGYLVPEWLLSLPRIAPINVHPSNLPKYRGSSPAQFALLFGETESAVCIMRMSAGMDEGPVISALPFPVEPSETAESYYRKAFALAAQHLPDTLSLYAQNHAEISQPEKSTTAVAKRLSREDGYIPYSILILAETGKNPEEKAWKELSPPLQSVHERQPDLSLAELLERATRALSPWPGVWTIVPHYKGREHVRRKILASHLNAETLVIDRWQYEGESAVTRTLSAS